MAKPRAIFVCGSCGQQVAQWTGRCPGCDGWGTIAETSRTADGGRSPSVVRLFDGVDAAPESRVRTGIGAVDRVLGGGIVPGSVVLLAGEPGIGKSTLLLQLVGSLASSGRSCLVASGEESHRQVAARAARLEVSDGAVSFTSGRDLASVLAATRAEQPFLLAVDSIQTLRDPDGGQMPGGVSQVRQCTDALMGLAKELEVAVLVTGHVTKDGDLAGPRALEHAVDVVLTFDGDPRSGLRVLSGGKNRFGAEGETAWFEMGPRGLSELDPAAVLRSGVIAAGAAVALPLAGRRSLAVEVQALVGAPEGPPRRHATGLDPRRFALVAAVLDRTAGIPLARAELFGAASGGVRLDDPGCDLAVAAALASAATGRPPPEGAAFVGEIVLTGAVRAVAATRGRLLAARTAGCTVVYVAEGVTESVEGVRVQPVRTVRDALRWPGVVAVGAPRDHPP